MDSTLTTTNPAADTTDTYRYGALYTSAGKLKVALPTKGDGGTNAGYSASLTAVGDATTPRNGSNAPNSTYNDLLAIWDAYNGTGTGTNSGVSGQPSGWGNAYWTASQITPGNHARLDFGNGYVASVADTNSWYVAVQVL